MAGGMLMVVGCSGSVADGAPSDEQRSVCEAHRSAMLNSTCNGLTSHELAELVYEECMQRLSTAPPQCRPEVERYYECSGALWTSCALEECAAERRDYAQCLSGGTCEDLGGGSALPASDNPDRASIFHDHLACACIEPWQAQAPGAACQSWEDCAPVCCACPGATFQYTAAACDFSQSADPTRGTCPTPERVCELAADRCP